MIEQPFQLMIELHDTFKPHVGEIPMDDFGHDMILAIGSLWPHPRAHRIQIRLP